ARRAVQGHVAGDNVHLRRESSLLRRIYQELPARETLPEVVIRVALERQGDAAGNKCSEALPGRAEAVHADCVVGQTFATPAARHFVSEPCADCAMDVTDAARVRHGATVLECLAARLDEPVVKRLLEPVILRPDATAWRAGRQLGSMENCRE